LRIGRVQGRHTRLPAEVGKAEKEKTWTVQEIGRCE